MSLDAPQPLPPEVPAAPPFPRLSIRDWFVGTLLCCTLYTLQRMRLAPFDDWLEGHGPLPIFDFGCAVIWAAQAVVAIKVIGLLITRRTVNGLHPGHWVCLAAVVPPLIALIPSLGPQTYSGIDLYGFVASETTKRLLLAAAVFAPAFLCRLPTVWMIYSRLYFGAQIAALLLLHRGESEFNTWIQHAEVVLVWGSILSFCVAFVGEIVRRKRQDWGHWVGVLTPLANFVVLFAERLTIGL